MSVPERRRLTVRGAVQGVGFRPFVYRLARDVGLAGWVANTPGGAELEVEGERSLVDRFLQRLVDEIPLPGRIHGLEQTVLDPVGGGGFAIRTSDHAGERSAVILPDIGICHACRAELRDPANRRYRYPFINCTHCGPRFSIIRALPYDRVHTTMASFTMCESCRREYDDPGDRRFHAQPNACPRCGPRVRWQGGAGGPGETENRALAATAEALTKGLVVAVKGLGGFHLLVDARRDESVRRLRARKNREAKPLAVMVPTVEQAESLCVVSKAERRMLQSPEAPIVLLRRREEAGIAASVAPGNPELGVMLPYTPLHEVLLSDLGFPVVATSGNLSEEPICIRDDDAFERLGSVADGFLTHDRSIARRVEDSVVRVVAGQDQVLRRGRGYAPLPVTMPADVDGLLAVGGHLKNCVALGVGRDLMLGPHIGDLDGLEATRAFERMVVDLQELYRRPARRIVCDLHPDYRTTRYARQSGLPVRGVQHHAAHVAAVVAESRLSLPVHGVAWDGTGYGEDGMVWGGEFFEWSSEGGMRRTASLRPFPLPGGEAAVREPRRTALGWLAAGRGTALWSDASLPPVRAFTGEELRALRRMMDREGVPAVRTTSMGRLFDAVASLVGLCHVNRFEGEAAMALEFAASGDGDVPPYPFAWYPEEDLQRLDWGPMLGGCLADLAAGLPPGRIAARFHSTLVEILVSYGRMVSTERLVLSGGCFQNRRLTEQAVHRLRAEGFQVYRPQRVPPGDGGLAVGQAALAASEKREGD